LDVWRKFRRRQWNGCSVEMLESEQAIATTRDGLDQAEWLAKVAAYLRCSCAHILLAPFWLPACTGCAGPKQAKFA